MSTDLQHNRVSRWYFGGVASSGAACFTHPLDLLKVTLQTQQKGKLTAVQLTGKIIRERGILALYNGLSASLLRQITYSTTRFGLYPNIFSPYLRLFTIFFAIFRRIFSNLFI